jgi:hypothetical protein
MSRATIRLCALALVLVSFAGGAQADPGREFLAKVAAAVAAGELTPEEALLYKFHYGFDQEKLPAAYRPDSFAPLKNGTEIVWEYQSRRDDLSPSTVAVIDGYLARAGGEKATYISPSGRFRLTYSTVGTNAVPSTDTSPANGIPDYVEKIATYCDYSWDLEVTTLGFGAPPISPYYDISFESMGYYGYTTVVSGTLTRIVLHNTFVGFPPNDDPEGNQWGAAKVTVAHEFKHATQRVDSGWSEGGWVELDATWMEDIAYDVVNDYYNYLPGQSPIQQPAASLDAGGTGSYEDCVWQHWMTETWGNAIITDFWDYRGSHTTEPVMASYETILAAYAPGVPLADHWIEFASWNYACGTRAIAGLGYGEAADYPNGTPAATVSTYPAAAGGSVAHLAANAVRCVGIGGPGAVRVIFDGQDGSAVRLAAVIRKTDATGVIEVIPLDAARDADVLLSVPRDEIAEVGLVVGNGARSGGDLTYAVDVEVVLPAAVASVTPGSVEKSMEVDQTSSETIELSNAGAPGSVLAYTVHVLPDAVTGLPDKSVAGSTCTSPTGEYEPGTSAALVFDVYNGSADDEWLTDVTLDFPAGVTVVSSTNFVGGSYGAMVSSGAAGDGALVSWHGDTGSPYYYGVVIGGETVTATVTVSFGGGLSGDVVIPFTISGDIYGSPPHTVGGSVVLTMAAAALDLTAPDGGELWEIGDTAAITWTSVGVAGNVKIDLSRNGGATWVALSTGTANDGLFDWTVGGNPSDACLVRISSLDDAVSDQSLAPFTIHEAVAWLVVTPVDGALGEGETDVLTLDFDTTGLSVGDHAALIVIVHDAAGSPAEIPVVLHVSDPISGVGDAPLAFRLEGGHPNPFNPATEIAFTLPAGGPARLDVVDLRGRIVRTLASGELAAGPHRIRWDGRDDAGRLAAAGTYLARLATPRRTATAKITLAK